MKVGDVVAAVIITSIVTIEAHCPAFGVNVYVIIPAVAVLIEEGLQVPVIPFSDVVGSVPGTSPTQYGPHWVKVGVTEETVTGVLAVSEQPLVAVAVTV